MKRRNVLKGLTVLPFAGNVFSVDPLYATPLAGGVPGSFADTPNIFQSIGVEPIINCRGTFTIIGGSIELPQVRAAMEAASQNFIQYDELADGIGKKLAELTGAEWGMVSAGCAAGMKHITAACVTGGDPEKLIRIPNLAGFEKTEVVIPRHSRNTYDHAIRNIGVKIITVDTPEELANALNPATAMIYLMADDPIDASKPLSLENVAKIAAGKNIPILVDAAAEVLTIPNIHLQRGATVVVYSGGKAICGPQCAGLVLGKKDILMSAWQASSPHHGPGRDNKVGREEMIGMMAAVEAWKKRDHAAEWKRWLGWINEIAAKVTTISGVTTKITEPTELSNKSPVLHVSWDPAKFNVTGEELAEELGRTKPRIAVGGNTEDGMSSISITTGQMQPGNEKIVAERVHQLLSQKRPARSTAMKSPLATLNGRWDVTIKFFSSTANHQFFIEQDGNWLQGNHQGTFSTRELLGTIEGDEIKIRTVDRHTADNIPFVFSGVVNNGVIKGNIHMGEYRTAEFTAQKSKYRNQRRPIVVPKGPPLAT
jgi:D-glucosaminate-6-phosphate ammonia-lyase